MIRRTSLNTLELELKLDHSVEQCKQPRPCVNAPRQEIESLTTRVMTRVMGKERLVSVQTVWVESD